MTVLYSIHAAILPLVAAIEEVDAGLSSVLLPRNIMPSLALRLLRYESDSRFFTNPHVDKSALTIIAHTDDPKDDPCLVFGPRAPVTLPMLSEFKATRMDDSHSVLFLGAALREGGYAGFEPVPHAVRPAIEPRVRHSAVFFWLLPGLDLKTFSTSVPYRDDLGLARY